MGKLAQRFDVEKMTPEIGALLLLRRSHTLSIDAPLERANLDEQHIGMAISQELDGLPLALDQAGAYIKETPCSLENYLTLYRQRQSTFLHERGSSSQNYPASVATTWSLSFERVSQTNAAAAELLRLE